MDNVGYIYKITNTINQKKYIGSTIRPEKRKKEHFYFAALTGSPSYYYPLQCAIRKYGADFFVFEIIEKTPVKDLYARERHYIKLYNTLANEGHGYNQTIETECALRDPIIRKERIEKAGKPCALVDKNNQIIEVYPSLHEASREELGINEASTVRKVCEGNAYSIKGKIFRWLDENGEVVVVENKTNKRCKRICGILLTDPSDIVFYESVSQAAREEKICRSSISKCIAGSNRYGHVGGRKWYYQEDEEYDMIVQNTPNLNTNFYKMIEINGEYKSFGDWCRHYNISQSGVHYRIKNMGMDLISALTTPKERKRGDYTK